MKSFLKSIHIENIDDFDLDFEMVGRNRFNYQQIDMIISKQVPWTYELLRQFQDGLNSITYPYILHFSYKKRPTSNDAINLFDDWFRYLYRSDSDIELIPVNDNVIQVNYLDESFKKRNEAIINDFKDFLGFISYDFIDINENVLPLKEVGVIADEETRKETVETASEQASEDIKQASEEPEILDRNDVTALVEKEQSEKNALVEDQLLKEMKKNREIMLKERERARLNRRGKYEYVERIEDITPESDHVDFNGKVFAKEVIERGERKRLNFEVVDEFNGAIACKMYQNSQVDDEFVSQLLNANVRVRGVAYFDDYSHQMMINAHYIDLLPPKEVIPDATPIKRVELHLHSNMSTQDGIGTMNDYCSYAKKLGHTAMAITDHGCVQGFPDAQAQVRSTILKCFMAVNFIWLMTTLNMFLILNLWN